LYITRGVARRDMILLLYRYRYLYRRIANNGNTRRYRKHRRACESRHANHRVAFPK
jgi:hypothetical protein